MFLLLLPLLMLGAAQAARMPDAATVPRSQAAKITLHGYVVQDGATGQFSAVRLGEEPCLCQYTE